MALKAFVDAMDRIVYLPGVKIYQVAYGLMRQRLLNQIRDRTFQGTLIQGRKDVQIEKLGDVIETRQESHPVLGASRVARQFADLILSGETVEGAVDIMQLTAAEYQLIKREIASELGFIEECEEDDPL
jgi:hypothetical protein